MNLSRSTFEALCKSIHQICGLVLSHDKEYLIRNRLEGLIRRRGLTGFDDLCQRLQRQGDASLTSEVIDAVTTQETSFFRDPHVFEVLAREIFPRLASTGVQQRRRPRILSAGVSTGQEAYSLAMLAREVTSGQGGTAESSLPVSILGGDISVQALQTAAAGVYDQREVARGLSPAQVQSYFQPDGGKFRVREPIRKLVEFQRLNLTESFTTLGTFDLICCRNVMIYFDEPTRRHICGQFHRLLGDDGWLLLGTAENLYGISTDFVSVPLGQALIYRKSKGAAS